MSPFLEDFMKQNYSEAGFKETNSSSCLPATAKPHFEKRNLKMTFENPHSKKYLKGDGF